MRVPDLKVMQQWDPSLVRVLENYDINLDIMVRQFDYLGPSGIIHWVMQPVTVPLDKLKSSLLPTAPTNALDHLSPHTLTADEMIDRLKKHFEDKYRRC